MSLTNYNIQWFDSVHTDWSIDSTSAMSRPFNNTNYEARDYRMECTYPLRMKAWLGTSLTCRDCGLGTLESCAYGAIGPDGLFAFYTIGLYWAPNDGNAYITTPPTLTINLIGI